MPAIRPPQLTNTLARRCSAVLATVLLLITIAPAWSQEALADDEQKLSQADREFFEKSIRPVLINRCQDCHNADNPESKLSVEHLADLIQGGTRGPAIVPGKPNESLLIRALSHGDVELQMPPKQKLPPEEIAAITDWIGRGAFWPGEKVIAQATANAAHQNPTAAFTADQLNYWAFQSPLKPPLPSVQHDDWVQNPIDYFVLSRLEEQGMHPAPPADKRTLIRRVYFDLLGLPPTPDEIANFLDDDAPDAYARLIDRCLASAHYGQRWGRYWLDVARYADSNGLDENLAHGHAFRYRDYVVSAMNADKPYDQFIQEQLAGDLLNFDPTTATTDFDLASQRLIATGFLSLGAKMLAEDDPVKMQMDIIDEQVDTLGKAFLGLTFGCARCHDHKFDPFSQDDYYGLAGIFKSTRTMENFSVVARWQELPIGTPSEVERHQQHKQKIDQHNQTIAKFQSQQNDVVLKTAREQLDRYLLAAQHAELLAKLMSGSQSQGDAIVSAAIKPSGVYLLEAEQFTRGNVEIYTTGYGEGIGVIVNKGELPNYVEYDVDVAQSGWYQLEVRQAAAESRPSRLSLNGGIVIPQAVSTVTGSWYPDTQTWHIEGFVELVEGKNTLRIERDGPFSHIDKLLLVPIAGDIAQRLVQLSSASDESPLQAVFVENWRKLLAGPLVDNSPLLPAQRAFQGMPADTWFDGLDAEWTSLFGESLPQSYAELANRYAEILRKDDAAFASLRKQLDDPQGPFVLPASPDGLYPAERQAELKKLRDELTSLQSELPKLPETMAVSDSAPENLRIHLRGSHLNLGHEVPRHFPRIFETNVEVAPLETVERSGRLELARWLTQPSHPLTSRVMVNRVWLWHFGKGLVRSPDNFGLLGELPTHPELLDWLAVEFAESGWSLKQLHRLILSSSAYQMSTTFRADYDDVDPENKWLWRMNRRRLEAEAVRDAILVVSGELDPQMQGSLLPTANRAYVTSTANVNPVVYDTNRRSIYLPVVRSALFEMFQAFDFADPSVLNGQRESTTVASQALFMMNSPFVAEKSLALAEEILAAPDLTPEQRVTQLFERILGREPTADEITGSLQYINDYTQSTSDSSAITGWQSFCRVLIASNEFLYIE
ncbi:MAG: DUF1553 domain-containing protein [Planctomycetaceae bacterium]